ncbi:hypothetical protein TI39_contig289g00029 [Zymoseptoria brevis]|uniref:Uncharacterized protein n=1 Tax=Zymoseptoria brevis TaxID=1047168 RepID=A0A0F4GW67_9PEZI|nr:hypothetical protein TI39_contig289g00029 [Zymoseptoria brevis]
MAATSLEHIHSRESINVSHGFSSDSADSPRIPNSSITARTAPAPAQVGDSTAERVQDSLQDDEVVQDSLQDDEVAHATEGQTAQGKTAQEIEDDELYSVTPERTGQYRASQRLAASQHREEPAALHEDPHLNADTDHRAETHTSLTSNATRQRISIAAPADLLHAQRLLQAGPAKHVPGNPRTASSQDQSTTHPETPSDVDTEDLSTGAVLQPSAASQTSAAVMTSGPSTQSKGKLPSASSAAELLRKRRAGKTANVTPTAASKATVSKSQAAPEGAAGQSKQAASKSIARGKGKEEVQRSSSPNAQNHAPAVLRKSKMSSEREAQAAQVGPSKQKGQESAAPEAPEHTRQAINKNKRSGEDTSLDSRQQKRAKLAAADDAFEFPGSPESEIDRQQTKKKLTGKPTLPPKASKSQPTKASKKAAARKKSVSQPLANANDGQGRQTRSKAKKKAEPAGIEESANRSADDALETDDNRTLLQESHAMERSTNVNAQPLSIVNQKQAQKGVNEAAGNGGRRAAAKVMNEEGAQLGDMEEDAAADYVQPDGDDQGYNDARDSPPVPSKTQTRPGASQDAPVVVSDDDKSSSLDGFELEEPYQSGVIPINPATRTANPRTPAIIPSSPPLRSGFVDRDVPPGTDRTRKTQIIGFGQNGPLNQGSAPRKMLNEENPRHAEGAAPANLRGRRVEGPSSVATTIRTTKSQAPVAASNVSNHVVDALAVLGGKVHSSATPSLRPRESTHQSSAIVRPSQGAASNDQRPWNVLGEHHDHGNGDDFETFVHGESPQAPQAPVAIPRTASQITMPPPQAKKPASTDNLSVSQAGQAEEHEVTVVGTGPVMKTSATKRQLPTEAPAEHSPKRPKTGISVGNPEVLAQASHDSDALFVPPVSKDAVQSQHPTNTKNRAPAAAAVPENDQSDQEDPAFSVEPVSQNARQMQRTAHSNMRSIVKTAIPKDPLPAEHTSPEETTSLAKPVPPVKSVVSELSHAHDATHERRPILADDLVFSQNVVCTNRASPEKTFSLAVTKPTAQNMCTAKPSPQDRSSAKVSSTANGTLLVESTRPTKHALTGRSAHVAEPEQPDDCIPTERTALQLKPARRVSSKVARQSSRGSQPTVDLGGSPLAPGVEVDHRTTALEKHSQETYRLQTEAAPTLHKSRHRAPIDVLQPALVVPNFGQPSRGLEVISSNRKALPAAPNTKSTAIKYVKVNQAESAKLLQKSSPLSEDPFSASQKSRSRSGRDAESKFSRSRDETGSRERDTIIGSVSNFDKQMSRLRDHKSTPQSTAKKEPPKADWVQDAQTASRGAAVDMRSIGRRAVIQLKTGNAKSKINDDVLAAKIDASIGMLCDAIHSTRGPVEDEEEEEEEEEADEEDLDKTLVNESESGDEPPPNERSRKAFKPTSKSLPPKSRTPPVPSSSGSDSSDSNGDGFKPWKKSLKPHQRNLYKNLVNIAHRLTQYLADQETSTEVMMDENHRQHLRLLAQEKAETKQQFRNMKKQLKEKKKEKLRMWQGCERSLQETLDSWVESFQEQGRRVKKQEAENRNFEELLRRVM